MFLFKDVVEFLIEKGADVNIQTQSGRVLTPLLLASYGGNKEIVELLLANGAEINVKNDAGDTALDIAKQRNHTEIVELLREHQSKKYQP
jgi:ankyrin repeat protein